MIAIGNRPVGVKAASRWRGETPVPDGSTKGGRKYEEIGYGASDRVSGTCGPPI